MLSKFMIIFVIGLLTAFLHSDYYKNIVKKNSSNKKYMPNGSSLSLVLLLLLIFVLPRNFGQVFIYNISVVSVIMALIVLSTLIGFYTILMEYKEFKRKLSN